MPKAHVNITINAKLRKTAKDASLNLSQLLEQALNQELEMGGELNDVNAELKETKAKLAALEHRRNKLLQEQSKKQKKTQRKNFQADITHLRMQVRQGKLDQGDAIEIQTESNEEGESGFPKVYLYIALEDLLQQIDLQKLFNRCKDTLDTIENRNKKFLEEKPNTG